MQWLTRVAGAAAIALVAGPLVAAEDPVPLAPLHVIPTESQVTQPIPAGAPARVRISTADPQGLAAVLGVAAPDSQTTLDYLIDQYPQLRTSVARTWLEPTFVIDFNEEAFAPLRKQLAERGSQTTRLQLVEFVAGVINESDERNWDLASVVAERRKGDCSEHAVLTAALARLQGIPARVVLGVALVSDGKHHGAFGHAWAETLEDGKWRVADAALFEMKAAVRYLPIGVLEDEGMGYSMDLMRIMQIWVERVVVLGP